MSALSSILTAFVACLVYALCGDQHRFWFMTALGGLAATAIALTVTEHTKKEPYDLDHAVLNVQRPSTMWLNMGYWKDTRDFAEACESLATRLGDFAEIQTGDRILDLGYGCGESILLWERRYKPAKIVGVTSMQGHCRVAKDALGSADDVSLDTEIDLQVGDAVSWTQDLASKGDAVFDRIIALDCAYHFDTRNAFLESALSLLDPIGGTLGLTDLMLPSKPLSFFSETALRVVCWLAKVPYSNILTREQYEANLRRLGYIDVRMEDISEFVFRGLAEYIDSRGKDRLLKAALDQAKLKQYSVFAKVLRWWGRGNLSFVLVRARRRFEKSGTGLKRR